MSRIVVGALVVGLAVGLAIGLTRSTPDRAALLRRLESAITADARKRYRTPIIRTRCERYQVVADHYSCTAIQYQSPLSYSGQVYVAIVDFDHERFKFRPYKIPLWLGI